MKYFIIVVLLAFAFVYIFPRLRPYISTARRIFALLRDMQRMSTTAPVNPFGQASDAHEKLTRCDSCGTLFPATRALKPLSSTHAYCSNVCLERAIEKGKLKAVGRR